MSSPQKQQAKGGSRWGSLLSGAVAGLESRLDTILADDGDASAKSRAADKALQEVKSARAKDAANLGPPADDSARSASRNRVNDRLAERLAKAVNNRAGSPISSEMGISRTGSPLAGAASPRTSLDSRRSVDIPRLSQDVVVPAKTEPLTALAEDSGAQNGGLALEPAPESTSNLLSSRLPMNPARHSQDSTLRCSLDPETAVGSFADVEEITEDGLSSDPPAQSEVERPAQVKSTTELETEISEMRAVFAEAEKQRQEEMLSNFERIDALQAKLQYLAKETVAAAKEANADAQAGSMQAKVAEKDERIALLMEEGEKLSKTEMRLNASMKKLRVKMSEDEKAVTALNMRLSKSQQVETELVQKLRRAELVVRQSTAQAKQLANLEKDSGMLRIELETNHRTITSLRKELSDADARAEAAERTAKSEALQADRKKAVDLQDELSDAKLEKKLADDRAKAEIRRLNGLAQQHTEQSSRLEQELRSEIANLESRMEALRSRAEEASSDTAGDSRAKLLRQIETLQTQYSLAAENWRTIEGSLNGRLTAVEKERDEATKREADVRKKARDVNTRSKRAEEELENAHDHTRRLNEDSQRQREGNEKLQARVAAAEKALEDSKTDLDRQRRLWESELNQRLEEERSKNAQPGLGINMQLQSSKTLRTESPQSYRRVSNDVLHPRRGVARLNSHDLSLLTSDRALSRRSSAMTMPGLPPGASTSRSSYTPDYSVSPTMSRQESLVSLSHLNGHGAGSTMMPPTPSIQTADVDAEEDVFGNPTSPQQTINDVISASTVHTGPSVQLVERMSSSIRRLESEKAAHRDELARLQAQRDAARNEVVSLMREAEAKAAVDARAQKLDKELAEVKGRYEACLEMLGEREEEVQELRDDVKDMKRVYRELAETMGRE